MRNLFFIAALLLCFASLNCTSAQKKVTTLILLRHAEKDTSLAGSNPPLSSAGVARANRLSAVFPGVVPDAFYSTPFIRTTQTLKPWADATGKEITSYAPGNMMDFAEELNKQKGKTIVVVGHSNTIPALVNVLISSEKYKTLPDSEYNTIYVITIKNGNVKEKVLHF